MKILDFIYLGVIWRTKHYAELVFVLVSRIVIPDFLAWINFV